MAMRSARLVALLLGALAAACGTSAPAPAPVGAGGGSGGGGRGGSGGSVPGIVETCGNGLLEPGEECDGDTTERPCSEWGFASGTYACIRGGCTYDLTGCIRAENCENGIDDDGDALVDCEDDACVDAVECPRCGDGERNRPEEDCDGTDGLVACTELGEGFAGATRCTDDCTLDVTDCVLPEDCSVEGDEDADGAADCDDSDCAGAPPCSG